MPALFRPAALVVALVAPACYQAPVSGESEGSGTTDGTSASTTATATTATDSTDDSVSATDDSVATDDTSAGSGDTLAPADTTDASGGSTTGAEPGATVCDQRAGEFAMCGASFNGTPTYGIVACAPRVTDFSIFYEDVYTVDLVAGDCLYVLVDNIGRAGATGAAAADIALQVRSPSGLYAFHDDDVACTDPAWTGGACPQAQLTADVDGTFEIGVIQVSGAGCINPTPYTMFAATNGAELTLGTPTIDDRLVDCAAG